MTVGGKREREIWDEAIVAYFGICLKGMGTTNILHYRKTISKSVISCDVVAICKLFSNWNRLLYWQLKLLYNWGSQYVQPKVWCTVWRGQVTRYVGWYTHALVKILLGHSPESTKEISTILSEEDTNSRLEPWPSPVFMALASLATGCEQCTL